MVTRPLRALGSAIDAVAYNTDGSSEFMQVIGKHMVVSLLMAA
jgi:hypothetical protein